MKTMKRRSLLSLLVSWLLLFTTIHSQTPYTLQGGREGALFGAGAATLGSSILIGHHVEPLTPEEIAVLDAGRIWKGDRWVTRQWSPAAQKASDKFLLGSLLLPATLYLDQPARTDAGTVALISLESVLLTAGLTNLTKTLVKRPRPFVFNPDVPLPKKIDTDARYSFFSGHTSLTACMTFVTAKMYHDIYPESNARPYVWATAAIIPAVTGYLRIRGGKHYLTDVLVGYAIGAVVGVVVPEIHK